MIGNALFAFFGQTDTASGVAFIPMGGSTYQGQQVDQGQPDDQDPTCHGR